MILPVDEAQFDGLLNDEADMFGVGLTSTVVLAWAEVQTKFGKDGMV